MYALRLWSVRHARGLRRVYDVCARVARLAAPGVRLIGRRHAERIVRPLERAAKQFMFDCKMCGQCELSNTGMACPTNCAKQMRNGPCGGVRADGMCEVDRGMRCVWVEVTQGNARIGHRDEILHPLAPIERSRAGSSSWMQVICNDAPVRLPVSAAPALPPEEAASSFEAACRSGRFVVTVEVAPPDSADPQALLARAHRFDGLVDAINITDGAGGNCHMSSVAASALLTTRGLTPVYQVACRDRNRIAIQGDILGAAALGVRNILCLTGDDVSQGDHPGAKPVFDLDAVSLLHTARRMRDQGEFMSGRKIEHPPRLFIGASANPFVPPYGDRIVNLEKKIDGGAQFIQTQFCFDLAMFEDFMRRVRARGLHERARIIVGVGTLGSAKALRWMREHVPGVHVPEHVLLRIAGAADQKAEGKRVCIETIRALRDIEGVAGVHLMGHRNEDTLAQIIVESGVRAPAFAARNIADPITV